MENLSQFEYVKQVVKEIALKSKDSGFPNGQTLENILNNLDEYAVRDIIACANSAASDAQLCSNGRMRIEQFNDTIQFPYLPKSVQKKLNEKVASYYGTNINIEEEIRQAYLNYFDIPSRYKIPTKAELNIAEKKREELFEKRYDGDNYSNIEYRLAYINAEYDYNIAKLMYRGCNPLHDSNTIKYQEQRRLEAIEKLKNEFNINKSTEKKL